MASVSRVARRCAVLVVRSASPIGSTFERGHSLRAGVFAPLQSANYSRYGVSKPLVTVRFSSSDAANKLGPMNSDIRARVVNVVDDDGVMRRDVPIAQALQEARSTGVDLVQVAKTNGQVVCRLFNAQKRLFSLKKAMKQSKPKQDKEVTFGVKTETHDIQTKAAHVRNFLSKGHKVKVTVKFGREFHLLDRALEQLTTIEDIVGTEIGGPDHKPQNQFGGVYVHFVPRNTK